MKWLVFMWKRSIVAQTDIIWWKFTFWKKCNLFFQDPKSKTCCQKKKVSNQQKINILSRFQLWNLITKLLNMSENQVFVHNQSEKDLLTLLMKMRKFGKEKIESRFSWKCFVRSNNLAQNKFHYNRQSRQQIIPVKKRKILQNLKEINLN